MSQPLPQRNFITRLFYKKPKRERILVHNYPAGMYKIMSNNPYKVLERKVDKPQTSQPIISLPDMKSNTAKKSWWVRLKKKLKK